METTLTLCDAFDRIRHGLQLADVASVPFAEIAGHLRVIGEAARDASQPDWADFSEQLAQFVTLASSMSENGADVQDVRRLCDRVTTGIECLQQGLEDLPGSAAQRQALSLELADTWGEYLDLLGNRATNVSTDAPLDDAWASELTPHLDHLSADETTGAAPDQIGLILSSLSGLAALSGLSLPEPASSQPAAPQPARSSTGRDKAQAATPAGARVAPSVPIALPESDAEPLEHDTIFGQDDARLCATELEVVVLSDPEIREAFMDDAQRGLSSIEACLLTFEADASNPQPLRQVCRELHTLKGASGSVGLETLAKFLHQVEDDLQAACDAGGTIDLQPIFQAVDAVRAQVNCCQEPRKPSASSVTAGSAPSSFVESSGSSADSVRVKSAQLDRLMDMLAELVMLRNRRESRVEQLKSVHGELVTCVSRLRAYEENYSTALTISNAHAGHVSATALEHAVPRSALKQRVSSLTEIANDLLEIGGNLRELYDPVAEEVGAMSRFIRNFRQELIQLRRVPIAGLFQRLQRSARDAARVENKQVRLQLLGEQVGLESSLQQQLYEPLLHIVRNAVSHGIETEDRRLAAGKSATGTVTLEAHGSSNMLVITVRDDGRGLDYDALRRRGVEMGLISPDRPISRQELARLIFHAGFSTRTETSEISGRGVGMDVVATALERMHSWIEVDSVPGHGTSVRLLIPLHSVIEHVMVFRSGRQEFAIPTQAIKYAGDAQSIDTSEFPLTRFSRLFAQIESNSTDQPQLLVVSHTSDANGKQPASSSDEERRLGILVDKIVGPEEVVVRPLPNLMRRQPYLSGVTLSGTGDIMLILDSQQLLDHGLAIHGRPRRGPSDGTIAAARPKLRCRRVLVVDDSRSSRRTLVRCLKRYGYEIDEANDGLDAIRRLKDAAYDLIFSDLEMPQMGGMELLREVRTMPGGADLPFVIVSSRGEEHFRQQAKQLKVTDYLTKPVSDAIVSKAIERLNQKQER